MSLTCDRHDWRLLSAADDQLKQADQVVVVRERDERMHMSLMMKPAAGQIKDNPARNNRRHRDDPWAGQDAGTRSEARQENDEGG